MPLAAELIQDSEIMTQSPSQTVSIYEALAEILTKPTESLSLSNSKSTDRTLFSEAPISSTTTSTTTTTTSTTTPLPPTTEANDDLKVENSTLDGLDYVRIVNTARVNNQQLSTQPSTEEFKTSFLTQSPFAFHPNLESFKRMTDAPLDFQSMTPSEEFSTFSSTTTTNSMENLTDFEFSMTNNVTELVTNVTNETEIETMKANLLRDKSRLSLKRLEFYSPNSVIRRNFKKISTSTVPANYSPRFSAANRIPILSFGSSREERKIESNANLLKIDLMTKKFMKNFDDENYFSTPSVFPIYRPEFETTTVPTIFSSSQKSINEVTEMTVTSSVMTLTNSDVTTSTASNLIDSENSTTAKIEPAVDSTISSVTLTEGLVYKLSEVATIASAIVASPAPKFDDLSTELSTQKALTTEALNSENFSTEASNSEESITISNLEPLVLEPTDTPEILNWTSTQSSNDQNLNFRTPIPESNSTNTQSTISDHSALKPSISIPTPSSYPFNHPKFVHPQPSQTQPPTKPPQITERIIYAILPNNTVVRKVIQQRLTTENPYVIYSIFPNNTIIRRFRNGTIVPDESSTRIEITNLNPKSLTNPNSEFHLQASTLTSNLSPLTEQTKTVFYQILIISVVLK